MTNLLRKKYKNMKATLQYLKYIFWHKWYVFVECCKLGVVWRGLVHDMSKLLPSEFFAYREYFYGHYSIDMMPQMIEEDFEFAWHWHLKRNKHHWQWWITKFDEGRLKVCEMPMQYRKEMLADWIGAGKAINKMNGKETKKDEVVTWYEREKGHQKLAPDTRKWIDEQIERIKK